MTTDSPREIPENRCVSKSWKWWPGTESNHRHADFQSNGRPSSARVSRRARRIFFVADRTAPPDRAYTEPRRGRPTEPRCGCHAGQLVALIATERGPNCAPNGAPRGPVHPPLKHRCGSRSDRSRRRGGEACFSYPRVPYARSTRRSCVGTFSLPATSSCGAVRCNARRP